MKHTPKYVTTHYTGSGMGTLSNSFNVRLEGDITEPATHDETAELLRQWVELAAVFPQAKPGCSFDKARDFLKQTEGRGVLWLTVGGL